MVYDQTHEKPFGYLRTVAKRDIDALVEYLNAHEEARNQFLRCSHASSAALASDKSDYDAPTLLAKHLFLSVRETASFDFDRVAKMVDSKDTLTRSIAIISLGLAQQASDHLVLDEVSYLLAEKFNVSESNLRQIADLWIASVRDIAADALGKISPADPNRRKLIDIRAAMEIAKDEWLDAACKELGCECYLDSKQTDIYDWGWVFYFVPLNGNAKSFSICTVDRLEGNMRPLGDKIGIENAVLRLDLWYKRELDRKNR